ncbi:MAG: hypothetical protein HQL23_04995 [Candidatus Omnitrophica bacterium]|nr:hypothetical protein [Candidatus Omnitrophota bacterium]
MTEKTRKRILLMYITKVSGHRQATLAIQKALRECDPNVEAPAVNGFGYTYPVLERVINQAYMSVIKRTPKVWDYLYDNPKVVKNTQSIKNFLHKTSHKKVSRLLTRHHPDAIVCTQAFPCGMIADYKRSHQLNTLLVAVLTDMEPHSFWINEGVDYYVVPSLDAKERLIAKGVVPDRIKIYGIPIRTQFCAQLDKKPIQERLGLDGNLPTVLVMGGGQGLGPIKGIVKSLVKVAMNFQIIVLAGKNPKVLKSLKSVVKKSDKKILVFEYIKNVDEIMEISTLIITKPGGITTAECLTKGLPMVIVNPIPGQESRNADFLIKHGIGIRIDDTRDIGEEVELLLRSPERLEAMRRAAFEKAKPHASLDVARMILDQIDAAAAHV